MKYFITAIPSLEHSLGRENTGDFDYTCKISDLLSKLLQDDLTLNVVHLDSSDVNEVMPQVLVALHHGKEVCFHLILNPPGTGMGITAEHLAKIKAFKNSKIVITVVEAAKHRDNPKYYGLLDDLIPRIKFADKLIFLDDADKQFIKRLLLSASSISQLSELDPATINRLKFLAHHASVIPVPATVPIFDIPIIERGDDILVFGTIREGKGFAYVLEYAKYLKNLEGYLSPKKINIHIVGSVPQNTLALDKGQQLSRLLKAVYPSLTAQLDEFLQHNSQATEKELLAWYLAQPAADAALPIKLHFNVPASDLGDIIRKCKFAWYPAYRGATLRNSSLSSMIANNLIVISHITPHTPRALKRGGKYHDSLKLFEDFSASFEQYKSSVHWAVTNLLHTENNFTQQLSAQRRLYNDLLSDQAISDLHMQALNDLKSPVISDDKTKYLENKYGHRWLSQHRAIGSETKIMTASQIDVGHALNTNLAKLIAQFKNQPLTEQEKKYLDLMLKCNWTIQHISPNGDAIIESGKIMSGDALIAAGTGQPDHTPENLGQTSLVFLTLAPSATPPVPGFLSHDAKNTTFYFNYKQAVTEWPDAYIAGHWYAFQTQQTQKPMRLGNSIITVRYRVKNHITDAVKCIDIFDLSIGKLETIEITIEEDLFKLKDASIALSLKLIQILRKCDQKTYDQFFSDEALATPNKAIKTFESIFHSGYFEVHKPWSINLSLSYSHAPISPSNYSFDILHSNLDVIKVILNDLTFNTPLEQPAAPVNCKSFVLLDFGELAATVFSGNLEKIDEKLISYKSSWFALVIQKNGVKEVCTSNGMLSPFFALLCLISPKLKELVNFSLGYPAINLNLELAEKLYAYFIAKNQDPLLKDKAMLFYPTQADVLSALAIANDIPNEWLLRYINSPLYPVDQKPLYLLALQHYNDVIEDLLTPLDVEARTLAVSKALGHDESLFFEAFMLSHSQDELYFNFIQEGISYKSIPATALFMAVVGRNQRFFEIIQNLDVDINVDNKNKKTFFMDSFATGWDGLPAIACAHAFKLEDMKQFLLESGATFDPQKHSLNESIIDINLLFLAIKISDTNGKSYFVLHSGAVGVPMVPSNYTGMPVFGNQKKPSCSEAYKKIRGILPAQITFNEKQVEFYSSDTGSGAILLCFSLAALELKHIDPQQMADIYRNCKLVEAEAIDRTITHKLSTILWKNIPQEAQQQGLQDILDNHGPKQTLEYRFSVALSTNDEDTIKNMLGSGELNKKDEPLMFYNFGENPCDLMDYCLINSLFNLAKLLLKYGFKLPNYYNVFPSFISTNNRAGIEFYIRNSDADFEASNLYHYYSADKAKFVFIIDLLIEHAFKHSRLHKFMYRDELYKKLARCDGDEWLLNSGFIESDPHKYSLINSLSEAADLLYRSEIAEQYKFDFYLKLLSKAKKVCTNDIDKNFYSRKAPEYLILVCKFGVPVDDTVFDMSNEELFRSILCRLYQEPPLPECIPPQALIPVLYDLWMKMGSDIMSNAFDNFIRDYVNLVFSPSKQDRLEFANVVAEFMRQVYGSVSSSAKTRLNTCYLEKHDALKPIKESLKTGTALVLYSAHNAHSPSLAELAPSMGPGSVAKFKLG